MYVNYTVQWTTNNSAPEMPSSCTIQSVQQRNNTLNNHARSRETTIHVYISLRVNTSSH